MRPLLVWLAQCSENYFFPENLFSIIEVFWKTENMILTKTSIIQEFGQICSNLISDKNDHTKLGNFGYSALIDNPRQSTIEARRKKIPKRNGLNQD